MSFVVGQRWISQADLDLGLGTVVEADDRRVTLLFPAVEEERTYATRNAPLSRLAYRIDDVIRLNDDRELTVTGVEELHGLLIYIGIDSDGKEHAVSELHLSPHVQLSGPRQRLESGQLDSAAAFQLRFETLRHADRLQQSPVAGLLGSRTSLLPHQVYIAGEVARRHAPRVMLADEVGLGKTIEAGMIIHQRLHTGVADRVLILVPEPLLHQWLVEMLRRFNLRFSLFDATRIGLDEADLDDFDAAPEVNPFETEQLVLCAQEWLERDAVARELALAAPWDMLVVDEAHHLQWRDGQPGSGYALIEALAARTPGLLLLTATPEQAGAESHFARLRLLDPSRFHDFEAFRAEQEQYRALNTVAQAILAGEPISGELAAAVQSRLGDSAAALITADDREALLRQLLDRHGTGRVLFRNTRAAVSGFPERRVHPQPLLAPEDYPIDALCPERQLAEGDWLERDPRVTWLESFLKKVRPAKVLVICASAETAIALEHHLHLRAGIRSAAFHEGLSLIERDRAAAWFADEEMGAQALVCSEIGSEGRNFQFASQLVLFDLPDNPDLLEQRIGRLDRIGQGAAIDIHVPYLAGTAQEVLFRWYHEGLDNLARSFAAGFELRERFGAELEAQLANPDTPLEPLLADTRAAAESMREQLAAGRDALLELNSCRPEAARQLIDQLEHADNAELLQSYMEQVWDYFGVDHEHHSAGAQVVRPSDHQLVPDFPELPLDGVTVTFDRERALSREDIAFLSWEHPMVLGAMDLILNTEHGNSTVASMSIKGLKPGTLLMEAIFSVQLSAPRRLQLQRFLPLSPLRFVVDINGKSLGSVLPHDKLNGLCKPLPRATAQAAIKQLGREIGELVNKATQLAEAELPALVKRAETTLTSTLTDERDRLAALREVNPAIRQDEIDAYDERLAQSRGALRETGLQLQALRLIINT